MAPVWLATERPVPQIHKWVERLYLPVLIRSIYR